MEEEEGRKAEGAMPGETRDQISDVSREILSPLPYPICTRTSSRLWPGALFFPLFFFQRHLPYEYSALGRDVTRLMTDGEDNKHTTLVHARAAARGRVAADHWASRVPDRPP